MISPLLFHDLSFTIIDEDTTIFENFLAQYSKIRENCLQHFSRATLKTLKERGFSNIVSYLQDTVFTSNVVNQTVTHVFFSLKPLHLAALLGNTVSLKALLMMGADPHLTDAHGMVPADYASAANHPLAVELLSQQGARVKNYKALDLLETFPRLALASELYDLIKEHRNEELEFLIEPHIKVTKHFPKSVVKLIREYYNFANETHFDPQVLQMSVAAHPIKMLHVAVLATNHFALEQLLQLGCDPNMQDFRSWTAAHHAAIKNDQDALSILKRHGADFTLLNDDDGTPGDLLKLLQPPPPLAKTSVQVWDRKRKRVKVLKATEVFKDEPHVVAFSEEVHSTSKHLFSRWAILPDLPSPRCHLSLIPEIKRRYVEWKKGKSQVAIVTEQYDDRGVAQPPALGKGVVATTLFRPGDLICEYGGEHLQILDKDKETLTPEMWDHGNVNIFSNRVRSYASLASDGHPNSLPVYFLQGGMSRVVLVALENIHPGDPIVYNYVNHSIKSAYAIHIELRPQAFQTFWSSEALIKRLKSGVGPIDTTTWEGCHFREKLFYSTTTMSAYYRIIFQGKITHFELSRLFLHPQVLTNGEMRYPFLVMSAFMKRLERPGTNKQKTFENMLKNMEEVDSLGVLLNYIKNNCCPLEFAHLTTTFNLQGPFTHLVQAVIK